MALNIPNEVKNDLYASSPRYEYKEQEKKSPADLIIKENFWHKFFSFNGRLDQLGFMVRLFMLILLPTQIMHCLNGLIFMNSNEITPGNFKFFVLLYVCGKAILGIAYLSLIIRRLNDIGAGKILLLLPVLTLLVDLSMPILFCFTKDLLHDVLSGGISADNRTFALFYLYLKSLDSILKIIILFFFLFLCLKKGVYADTKHGPDRLYQNCQNYLKNVESIEIDGDTPTSKKQSLFKRFSSFKGRFNQYQFLLNLAILIVVYKTTFTVLSYFPNHILPVLTLKLVLIIILLVAFLALCFKRLHDKNRSGLFAIFFVILYFCHSALIGKTVNDFNVDYFFSLIVIFGVTLCLSYPLMFYLILGKGTKGNNKYGCDTWNDFCQDYTNKAIEPFA